ncbi:MAG: prephenate dehydrogenase/arogenate dehydrogenase family protein [Ectothiorhodospiraceae bacterium]|nr:prephenate dehydrogenase/arogenate dehydrogenase family protein [Ectothiorhodospiraceae bacterium]
MIKQLTIIGVGLIGGSLALALKRAGAVGEVVGCGRDIKHLQRAVELGVIDRIEMDMAASVQGADIVLVAAPVGAMEAIFRILAPVLPEGAVLTDAGSTKGSVVEAARAAFKLPKGELPANFVPGHPIAGTEKSGVEAAFSDLYKGRRVILTPTENSDSDAVARVRAMWEQAGADVVETSVAHHDEVLAATSHLPHLLAFSLVDTLATMDDKQEIFEFAAGGFRDFTRIASSDPQMWHDICIHNEPALLKMLERFENDLDKLRLAIANNDSDYLLQVFTRAKTARDQFCDK